MKAQLLKRQDRWDLYLEDGSKIASSAPNPMGKLSVKNCEAIANGYDLDELADEHCNKLYHEGNINWDRYRIHFKLGFQKALELVEHRLSKETKWQVETEWDVIVETVGLSYLRDKDGNLILKKL